MPGKSDIVPRCAPERSLRGAGRLRAGGPSGRNRGPRLRGRRRRWLSRAGRARGYRRRAGAVGPVVRRAADSGGLRCWQGRLLRRGAGFRHRAGPADQRARRSLGRGLHGRVSPPPGAGHVAAEGADRHAAGQPAAACFAISACPTEVARRAARRGPNGRLAHARPGRAGRLVPLCGRRRADLGAGAVARHAGRSRADRLRDDEPGFFRPDADQARKITAQISSGRYMPACWPEAVAYRPPAALAGGLRGGHRLYRFAVDAGVVRQGRAGTWNRSTANGRSASRCSRSFTAP